MEGARKKGEGKTEAKGRLYASILAQLLHPSESFSQVLHTHETIQEMLSVQWEE